jgi:hypothetical protein
MALFLVSLSIPPEFDCAHIANDCSEILTNVMRDAVHGKKGMLADEA